MPASSSVVWPAYGAVRARDVGRDRMDLMYSPMLVRLHNRKQLPGETRYTAPEPPHYYYVLS